MSKRFLIRYLMVTLSIVMLFMLAFNVVTSRSGVDFIFRDSRFGAILLFILIIIIIVFDLLKLYGKNYKLLVQLDMPLLGMISIVLSILVGILYFMFNKEFMCGIEGLRLTNVSLIAGILSIIHAILGILDVFVVEK